MSKESQNNNFELFEKINKKYFLEIEQNVPHIQQTCLIYKMSITNYGKIM